MISSPYTKFNLPVSQRGTLGSAPVPFYLYFDNRKFWLRGLCLHTVSSPFRIQSKLILHELNARTRVHEILFAAFCSFSASCRKVRRQLCFLDLDLILPVVVSSVML